MPRLAGLRVLLVAGAVLLAPRFAAAQEEEEKNLVEVTGTVVVDDGQGKTVDDESGTIVLGVHEGNGWRPQNAHLIEGAWKVKVPASCQLSFEAFRLDAGIAWWWIDHEDPENAHLRSFEQKGPRHDGLPIPADRHLEIRARYVSPLIVHVVDAGTHAELEHVTAVLDVIHMNDHETGGGPRPLGEHQLYPAGSWRSDVRLRDQKSPVTLTMDPEETFPQWQESLWIHAAGYCWQQLTVSYREGGESTLALVRGGTLVVKVDSERLPALTRIVLRAQKDGAAGGDADEKGDEEDSEGILARPFLLRHRDKCLEWPFVSGSPAVFDGIPVGRYRLDLEMEGRWNEKPIEFAGDDVVVKTGETTTAMLKVKDAPSIPDPVALRGSIRIDPGWGETDVRIELRPEAVSPFLEQEEVRIDRSELSRDPSDPSRLVLPPAKMAPGTYSLEIAPFGIKRAVAILRAARPLDVDVGPPIASTFHFVDDRTKAPVAVADVSFHCIEGVDPLNDVTFGHMLFRMRNDGSASATQLLRVPASRIALSFEVKGFVTNGPSIFDVDAEHSEFTVPLRHETGVVLRLHLDGKPIAWDDALADEREKGSSFIEYDPELHRRAAGSRGAGDIDGDMSFGEFDGGYRITVEHGGDYTLTLPPTKAYEPIAPKDLTIADQETTELVIDLVRKKQ